MKKITSIVLALLMLVSVLSFGTSAVNENDYVAKMWFCSEINSETGLGHVFLYFENLSDDAIMVGRYKVEPNKSVSVGAFGTEGKGDAGVYYNMEQELTQYRSLKGINEKITQKQLDAVNKKISNYNHWSVILNCYYFAAIGWNAAAENSIPFMIFPTFARIVVQLRGGKSNPFDLYGRTDPVYEQKELPAVK